MLRIGAGLISISAMRRPCPISTQYLYYIDGAITLRKGVRGGLFVVDKTLTSTGFSGSEGTDWTNLKIVE